MIGIYTAAIIVCVVLSGVFSAEEMAYSSCNTVRLERYRDDGSKTARTALKILDHFDDALSSILVGNNLVNIACSSLGSLLVILVFGEQYAWLSTLILTVTIIIFGETVPKIAAKKNATRYAMKAAYPLRILMIVLKPVTAVVVGLVNLLTRGMKGEEPDEDEAVSELHSIIDTAENEKVLDEGESELVSKAIDFGDISASEIMTARVDIEAIDIHDSWDNILETVNHSTYSRLPVYEDDIDHVIGVLTVNHFLKALADQDPVDIRKILLPCCFVYKTSKLPAVLQLLRDAKQHLAVVTDEYGGTLGVVTLEDVMEQLVGDIWDDTDVVAPDMQQRQDGSYELEGDVPVSDLLELLGWSEEEFDFESSTVGGWCIEMLDSFPKVGDSFTYENVKFTIEQVQQRRVLKVLVTPPPPGEEEQNDQDNNSDQDKEGRHGASHTQGARL